MSNRVLVVGSGASAVHAAWPLVKAGLEVLMVDVGNSDEQYAPIIPEKSFREIRLGDPEQHRYFLGDDFEGVPFGPVRVGAQLTPPRQHVHRDVAREQPLDAPAFQGLQSLALGGLAAAWGAGCFAFNEEEIADWPIGRRELQPHYDAVARRIGVCGSVDDDLAPTFGQPHFLLPPAETDSNGEYLQHRYLARRQHFNARGLLAGHPRLAALTEPMHGRGPLRYFDMEFWADKDRAFYRPRYTVEELRAHGNFEYRPGLLVERYATDAGGGVKVSARNIAAGTTETLDCARLVLAAGTIGTARIVLNSTPHHAAPLPFASNPYTYYPCLLWPMIGRAVRDRRHSLTQFMLTYRPEDGSARILQAQAYSYRSLLTFKLVKESPLPVRESIKLMTMLQPYYVIIGIHHEDRPGDGKSLSMGGGRLRIDYAPGERELARRQSQERSLMRLLRAMGCLPLKRILPGEGASIHYGCTLPMTTEDRPMTTRTDGSLRGAAGVYVSDGSLFPSLPSKGLTFTLMANANRVGEAIVAAVK